MMKKRFILITILALIAIVGGVGIGLAWRTNRLDKWLPPNIKEMFGRGEKPEDASEGVEDILTKGESFEDISPNENLVAYLDLVGDEIDGYGNSSETTLVIKNIATGEKVFVSKSPKERDDEELGFIHRENPKGKYPKSDYGVKFSPDGKFVVYTIEYGGMVISRYETYLIDIEKREEKLITDIPDWAKGEDYSDLVGEDYTFIGEMELEERYLIFEKGGIQFLEAGLGIVREEPQKLYLVSKDGKEKKMLVKFELREEARGYQIVWDKVYYTLWKYLISKEEGVQEEVVTPVAMINSKAKTQNLGFITMPKEEGYQYVDFKVSPDGKKIAWVSGVFSKGKGIREKLWLADISGKNKKIVLERNVLSLLSFPLKWSKDSLSVYLGITGNGAHNLSKVSLNTGEHEGDY